MPRASRSTITTPSWLVNKCPELVGDHKVRHPTSNNLPFHALVFSLGGMVNGSTTKVFASWKQERWVEHRRLDRHAMQPPISTSLRLFKHELCFLALQRIAGPVGR
jgi:hypothetical protein